MNDSDHLRQVLEAAQGISHSVAQHRQAIKAKQDQLQHATGAPGPPAEVLAERERYLDAVARARGAQQHAAAELVRIFGAPPGHSAALNRRGPDTPFTWAEPCYYFGNTIKAKDAEAVGAYAYTPGPAQVERAAVVATLEAELAELERAEEQFVDEAMAAGVTIAHRAEVTERRERERSQRERVERAAEAERRAAVAASEADDWPQPRVAHSTYIHGRRG